MSSSLLQKLCSLTTMDLGGESLGGLWGQSSVGSIDLQLKWLRYLLLLPEENFDEEVHRLSVSLRSFLYPWIRTFSLLKRPPKSFIMVSACFWSSVSSKMASSGFSVCSSVLRNPFFGFIYPIVSFFLISSLISFKFLWYFQLKSLSSCRIVSSFAMLRGPGVSSWFVCAANLTFSL